MNEEQWKLDEQGIIELRNMDGTLKSEFDEAITSSDNIPKNIFVETFKALNRVVPRKLYVDNTNAKWWKDNENTFLLAVNLKGVEGFNLLPIALIQKVVHTWYNTHEELLTDKEGVEFEFDEIWNQFMEAWDKVKYPKGQALPAIIEKAKKLLLNDKLPEVELCPVKKWRILVGVCYVMQQIAIDKSKKGPVPFRISQGIAGEVINRTLFSGGTALRSLVKAGILEYVEKGCTYKGGSAFWYLRLKPENEEND